MKKIKIHEILITILLGLFFITWFIYFSFKNNDLDVYFFNVGQGDSALIDAPTGYQILIDGGPDNTVESEVNSVMPFYDRKIDLVILTHPHADHSTGLVKILQNFEIGQVWTNGINEEESEDQEFQKIIKEKNIRLVEPSAGQYLRLGDLKLSVISPFSKDPKGNPNEDSLVIEMSYKDRKILFTGDMELEEQKELVGSGINFKSDILKQPHHGSEKFSQLFLDKIAPQYVVVSCGKNNRYGFPNPNTLEKLKDKKIFRTDQNGTIKAVIDQYGTLAISPL
ncbi:MAG: MBL fold metallo-hydrolase [Patescibacteria group bacterium]|jgi:competence protein ComEC